MSNETVEAYCNPCGGTATFTRYVIYAFTESLLTEASHTDPKRKRRRAPLLPTLAFAALKFLHFPVRTQEPRRF